MRNFILSTLSVRVLVEKIAISLDKPLAPSPSATGEEQVFANLVTEFGRFCEGSSSCTSINFSSQSTAQLFLTKPCRGLAGDSGKESHEVGRF